MSNHTPGPWRHSGEIRPCGGNVKHLLYCGEVRADESDRYLGSVCDIQSAAHVDGIGNDEAEANARLIAAAPDLLDALENCISYLAMTGGEWVKEKAIAAIAKARGEA